MPRKTYSEETKKSAAALWLRGKLTHEEVANKFGCSVAALKNWIKQYPTEKGSDASEEEVRPTDMDTWPRDAVVRYAQVLEKLASKC